ncbi:MAG: imidazole glycerol phosphate synthase subunit HisH [Campylobacterales bacterium]|nr:imidazole glycerol phosphate synthase subunit HisH [Campylobacterales bacterium]
MSDNIVIIDYKMGNLRSVQKAFEHIGTKAVISNDPEVIQNASKLVLPGVGAFKDAMHNLSSLGLIDLLNDEVIRKKKYFLGICLGMQLIASKSYEFGETKGLGWIDAEIVRFDFSAHEHPLKIPHVGWNSASYVNPSPLFEHIPDNSDFYFVHSYFFQGDKRYVSSTTDYGIDFISSVHKENIFATQFHPEKSQTHGLQIIKNFVDLKSDAVC